MPGSTSGSAILGDLLQINKDYFTACLRLIDKNKDKALYILLERLVDMERDFSIELRRHVDAVFGDPAGAVERKGEIYKAWQKIATMRIPTKKKEICSFCESRLQAIYTAYDRALNNADGFSEKVTSMLYVHLERMKESVDCIRKCRKEKTETARELLAAHY